MKCCRDDEEEDEDEEEEDGGEDKYEFPLSSVIDECARIASQDDLSNQSISSSGGSSAKKLKIVQSSYISNEEDED